MAHLGAFPLPGLGEYVTTDHHMYRASAVALGGPVFPSRSDYIRSDATTHEMAWLCGFLGKASDSIARLLVSVRGMKMDNRNREMKTDREAMPPLEVTCISSICAYRMLLHWMVQCSTRGPAVKLYPFRCPLLSWHVLRFVWIPQENKRHRISVSGESCKC